MALIDITNNDKFHVVDWITDYIEFSSQNQCNMAPVYFPAVYFKYTPPSLGASPFWIKVAEGPALKKPEDSR